MATTSLDSDRVIQEELEPVLSARWAFRPRHLVVCVVFGLLFVYLNCTPLLDSGIWLHLVDGHWMLDHRALPQVDAAQPLTDGMRIVHTTWLSQVLFALADRWGGPNGVSHVFALAMVAYMVLLARVFYLQTGWLSLMLAGLGVALVIGARYDLYASPEVFGQLCFAVLLWLLMRIQVRGMGLGPLLGNRQGDAADRAAAWPVWLAVGVLFAVWANLHGSFLLGVAVLACHAAAHAVEVGWKGGSLRAVLADGQTRRWALLADWALLASFLNPYGPQLILEVVSLVRNEKVVSMPEWLPLSISAPNGLLFLGSLVLLAVVLRHSRRGVRPVEVLLLAAFGAAAVPTARAQGWYAVVYAFVLMPHLADVCSRILPAAAEPKELERRLTARSFTVSLICALVLYCGFRWAPVSRELLGGTPRDMGRLVGSQDVYAVGEYLRSHQWPGLVYAPVEWGDMLVWQGAPELKVLMTSNVQWTPERIWSDHLRMAQGQEGWHKGMDRYGVNTLVIDKHNASYFAKIAKRSPKYRTVYENDSAVVLRRLDDGRRREPVTESAGQAGDGPRRQS